MAQNTSGRPREREEGGRRGEVTTELLFFRESNETMTGRTKR